MREGEQSDNIYVMVDSSKIARCKWCGVIQSASWTGVFCSRECMRASDALSGPLVFILATAAGLTFLIVFRQHILFAVSSSLILLMFGTLAFIYSGMGMRDRRSVPKNSRADDVPLDTALLATMSTSVVCPRCDAELDLRSISKDGAYACGYCGTTGTITVVDKSKQR